MAHVFPQLAAGHAMRHTRAVTRVCVAVLTLLALCIGPRATTDVAAEAAHSLAALPGSGPNFYKVAVTQTGMQAITYDALASAGLPLASIDSATFKLYEQGTEIARRIVDLDGSATFNTGDYILFYGRAVWTLYTTTNIYWLTFGGVPGLDMTARTATLQPSLPAVSTFRETLHLEQDLRYMKALPLTGNVDRWYWALYQTRCGSSPSAPGKFSATVNAAGVAAGSFTATLTPRLRGFNQGSPEVVHTAAFDLNGNGIGQLTFTNTNESSGTLNFSQSYLLEGANTLNLNAPCPTTSTTDYGVVNWYDVSYQRTYQAPASGQFAFAVDASQPAAVTLLGVAGGTEIYDISDPQHPIALAGLPNSTVTFDLSFSHTLNAPARYIAAARPAPGLPGRLNAAGAPALDSPSYLRSPTAGADWIIITPAVFIPYADQLAVHRRASQHYRTAVIDVQDVYDEFNGGLKDQAAIRAFLRFAYESWPAAAPQFVVLLGDGNSDPRNALGNSATDYIPPYLAAVNPFDGVVAADNRYVAYDPIPPVVNPAPFIALGRLPATSTTDAQVMVNKIIAYETTPVHDSWNRNVLFVADNADTGGQFPANSDAVADDPYYLPADYNPLKVYYTVNYADKTNANNAIIDAINQGALFVNYHGHASIPNWAGEPLLALTDQARMTNLGKYPIFLPMTCLEGNFSEPTGASFGESIVRVANGGAVASWSPTGKGVASGHDIMYRAFYEAVFDKDIHQFGPATTYAKQQLADSASVFKDLVDSYILFGDPAMPIDLPAAQTFPLSGQIYNDVNTNSVFDAGDGPLGGVTVTVRNQNNVIVGTPTSDASGNWSLNLPAGVYTVTAPANASGLALSSAQQLTVELTSNGNQNAALAFGYATPTGLEIEYLRPRWNGKVIDVAWATRLEESAAAYNLYRTINPKVRGTLVNETPLAPAAPPGSGATYVYTDAVAQPGPQYYYWLQVILLPGSPSMELWYGPEETQGRNTVYLPLMMR
jgi:hypothetical protein